MGGRRSRVSVVEWWRRRFDLAPGTVLVAKRSAGQSTTTKNHKISQEYTPRFPFRGLEGVAGCWFLLILLSDDPRTPQGQSVAPNKTRLL